MSDTKNEPLAAILAEARDKYTVHDCNECDYRKSCDLRFDCDECKTKRESISLAFGIEDGYFAKLLDRIEEAAERERAITDAMLAAKDKPLPHPDPEHAPPMQPGNAAAMRDALKKISNMADLYPRIPRSAFANTARAALAAPARNCDRFANWMRAWDGYLAKYPDAKKETPFEIGRYLNWLFAPAEGKEADNG